MKLENLAQRFQRRNRMPLVLEETRSLLEQLDTPEHWMLAHTLDTFTDSLFNCVKNGFPINAVPHYIEDELIGLKETIDLAAECYRKALGAVIGFLKDDLEEMENKKAKEEDMDREIRKVKKVIAKDSDKEMKAMKVLEKKDKVMDKKMEKCESTMSKKKK